MNSLVETLNLWGEYALHFARPMLWQSSLLLAALAVFDIEIGGAQATENMTPALEMEAFGPASALDCDAATGLATASIGVVVRCGSMVLTAERITADVRTGELAAGGAVRIRDEDSPQTAGVPRPDSANAAAGERRVLRLAQISLPVPNPYARTNLIHTGQGRQTIVRKLETIRVDRVSFDNLPLREVVLSLAGEARNRDPEKKGINFIINPNPGAIVGPAPGQIDPATGLPVSAGSAENIDIDAIPIKILPALTDLRLLDVLEVIVKVANRPIRYSIEDYAIVFSLRGQDYSPLETRVMRVDPNTFRQGLESVVGVPIGNPTSGSSGGGSQLTVPRVAPAPAGAGPQGGGINGVTRRTGLEAEQAPVRQFFSGLGVDLTPPKSVLLKDDGALIVHATRQDLETIEAALGAITPASPQINLRVRIMEVPSDGNASSFSAQFGSLIAPSTSPVQPQSTANALSQKATVLGVLTDPQLRAALRVLEQSADVKLLTDSSATTLTARQTQIQSVDLATVVKGINPEALLAPGVYSTNGAAPVYLMDTVPFGPVVDLVSSVEADGFTISVSVAVTVTQFLGYEDSPETASVSVYVDGKAQSAKTPMPRIRTRASNWTGASLRDGQTVVLSDNRAATVTGGHPIEDPSLARKSLLAFITATLVDSAGNRVHSEDENPPPNHK